MLVQVIDSAGALILSDRNENNKRQKYFFSR